MEISPDFKSGPEDEIKLRCFTNDPNNTTPDANNMCGANIEEVSCIPNFNNININSNCCQLSNESTTYYTPSQCVANVETSPFGRVNPDPLIPGKCTPIPI